MRLPPIEQAECSVDEGHGCELAAGSPQDRCQAGCCALGRYVASARGDGLSGWPLVVRAFAALILPGLVWIAAILGLSPYLGELAACAVGLLAWLLLLLSMRLLLSLRLLPAVRTKAGQSNVATERAGVQ